MRLAASPAARRLLNILQNWLRGSSTAPAILGAIEGLLATLDDRNSSG
jgi:hypothetical protein